MPDGHQCLVLYLRSEMVWKNALERVPHNAGRLSRFSQSSQCFWSSATDLRCPGKVRGRAWPEHSPRSHFQTQGDDVVTPRCVCWCIPILILNSFFDWFSACTISVSSGIPQPGMLLGGQHCSEIFMVLQPPACCLSHPGVLWWVGSWGVGLGEKPNVHAGDFFCRGAVSFRTLFYISELS